MGNNTKTDSSKKMIIVAIVLAVLIVFLAGLLLFTLIFADGKAGSMKSNLPENFSASDESYWDSDEVDLQMPEMDFVYGADTGRSDEQDGEYSGFVFPDSHEVALTDARIEETIKDQETCQRAINELYARRGYEFTKEENMEFFNQYDWYKKLKKETDMDKVRETFSKIELENAEKLQAYAESKGWR